MDEETDAEILALQAMFMGGQMAPVAITLALLDAGLIKRKRLLEIIESLHGILAAEFVGHLAEIEDAQLELENLRGWLDGSDWKAGHVVEQLRKLETVEFLRSQMRLANSRHRLRPPATEND